MKVKIYCSDRDEPVEFWGVVLKRIGKTTAIDMINSGRLTLYKNILVKYLPFIASINLWFHDETKNVLYNYRIPYIARLETLNKRIKELFGELDEN